MELGTSSLLVSIHSVNRYYSDCRGRKVISDLIQLWTLHHLLLAYQVIHTLWYNNGQTALGVANSFLTGFESLVTVQNTLLIL